MTALLKRALLSITTFVTFALTMNAQQYLDVVYLKNGSVIRGLITEQIPNQSLKIETHDGSTFICDMNDVEKIAKEFPVKEKNTYERRSEYGWVPAPRYRGFVGESVIIGTGELPLSRTQVFTSHGCQICPYLYVGGGLAVNYWTDDELINIPLFAHVRSEIHKAYNRRVSPYLETRIGYSAGDVEGFFCAPAAGCHIYFGKSKMGLSIGVGYNVQITDVYYTYSYPYSTSSYSLQKNVGGVSISAAFDF